MNDLTFVFAGDARNTYQQNVPAPVFRKRFPVAATHGTATLTVGATGFYELYLNGTRITKGYMAPFTANPGQTVFFDRYDLTDRLNDGENVLDVLVGNGFANPMSGKIWGHTARCAAPSFALQFMCDNVCFTAEDMCWKPSPILFDDYRAGVFCDMRKLQKGTFAPELEGEWQPAQIAPQPTGERRFTACEPIREIRRIRATEISAGALRDYRIRDPFIHTLYCGDTVMGKTPVSGGFVYDFGENNSGVPCLKIKGTRGQRIDLQFSELRFEGFVDYINVDVYPDGCCQHDVYICGSDEEETYIPPFTYHGFRYCYVHGITPEQATPDLLEYVVLHNDVPVRAAFTCSDAISNEIFAACRRSDESNLLNVITDCPHREKNGWTGDVAVSAEHYLFNLGVENCLRDWLHCVRNAQLDRGDFPSVIPSAQGGSNSPVWDSVIFYAPYNIFKYTGCTDVLAENADAMMKNLRYYMSQRDERGLVESGLGDWLPVDLQAGEYHAPLGFCCSVTLMDVCRMGTQIMQKLGRTDDAAYCEQHYALLREAVRREYNENGVITVGKTEKYRHPLYRVCQTSQALGLYVGVFDDEEQQAAFNCLLDCIHAKNDAFDCGFLGLKVLFYVLTERGYSDLAYHMITKPTHPSYANMIYRGETTVWERFMAPGKRIGSHNHHFMADVSAWYLRCVAGICVNPAWEDPNAILLEPHFITALTHAKATYHTPGGQITVAWVRENDRIRLCVQKSGAVTVTYGRALAAAEVEITES